MGENSSALGEYAADTTMETHPYFKWIGRGMLVKYLGCHVGLDVPKEVQISHLLFTIRKKLLFWSNSAKLSFAGRIVVANQVILTTIWYIASRWIFSRFMYGSGTMASVEFLWSGGDGSHAKAKVAWTTIVLPRHRGGSGLIDPWDQSTALIGKLMVRSFLPNVGLWAGLLHKRFGVYAPQNGGPWNIPSDGCFC